MKTTKEQRAALRASARLVEVTYVTVNRLSLSHALDDLEELEKEFEQKVIVATQIIDRRGCIADIEMWENINPRGEG